MRKTVIDFFFKQAEIGNWDKFTIDEAVKKLKLNEAEFKKQITSKEDFLRKYNAYVDKEVLEEIEPNDLQNSKEADLLQELLMIKLEKISPYKAAIANLFNYSITRPKLIILGLKDNKKSIKKFVRTISKKKAAYKSTILIKLVLGIWLLALNKWLYEEGNEGSFAIIDKSIKTLKKNTSFLD